ncbi:uncharacterized protein [Littorina saxatilis]|uniref:uncharacterized protein n=1 Tax=Littorina saxatilis TaxID=31220 RepID=UPI0038B6510E
MPASVPPTLAADSTKDDTENRDSLPHDSLEEGPHKTQNNQNERPAVADPLNASESSSKVRESSPSSQPVSANDEPQASDDDNYSTGLESEFGDPSEHEQDVQDFTQDVNASSTHSQHPEDAVTDAIGTPPEQPVPDENPIPPNQPASPGDPAAEALTVVQPLAPQTPSAEDSVIASSSSSPTLRDDVTTDIQHIGNASSTVSPSPVGTMADMLQGDLSNPSPQPSNAVIADAVHDDASGGGPLTSSDSSDLPAERSDGTPLPVTQGGRARQNSRVGPSVDSNRPFTRSQSASQDRSGRSTQSRIPSEWITPSTGMKDKTAKSDDK